MQRFWLRGVVKSFGMPLICCWTVIIGSLAALSLHYQRHDNLVDAENEARDYFRLNMFYRAWASKMGGVYVRADKVIPNPYLKTPNRDITGSDGSKLTLVNPAYMTRMVFESIVASSPDPIINKITSLKPLNPVNAPDAWERSCLEGFERKEYRERSVLMDLAGKPYLRLISQFLVDQSCMKCHAHQGYRVGDVRGGITISVPLARRLELARENDRRVGGGYLLLWMLGSSSIAMASRRRSLYETRLQADERKFRTVCDWTQDWEYWVAADGSMQYVSPSCFDITGYHPEDFLGDPELIQRIVHPDYRDSFAKHQAPRSAGLNDSPDFLEFPIITRKAEVRWVQHLCRPIFDGTVFLGRRASNRDITERKLAEEKISRLSDIVESSDDAIISKSMDGCVASWNHGAEKLFGYAEQEMLGKPLLPLLPLDRIAEEQYILSTISRGECVDHFETVRIRKDGKFIDVSMTISPIRDQYGAIIGISKIARDITANKRAAKERLLFERQMMQTQKLESLGVLAGGIAHDFNNILMVILGNTDLAMMRINKESPATENLRQVQEAANRAAELARQMLAYSGKGKFIVESIDLNTLVRDMMHMLEVSISKKALLKLHLHEPLPKVAADATQLRQIIMNLVINASEAIGDQSGVIAITTGFLNCDQHYLKQVWLDEQLSEGLYTYLEIADTGCGMDQVTLSRIFDPFFTTKFTGRGLGMAAVLGIIRGHKGAMQVDSEPGQGTTFKLLLPASDVPGDCYSEIRQADSSWQGRGTVLLVDDEETILRIGSEMLREIGFDVITALDGRGAIDLFVAHREVIACVLLDLTMPNLDGEQTFRELRKLDPDLKVIISSGYHEQEVTRKFAGQGLAGFIQKPYKLSALRNVLNSVLGDEQADSLD